MMGNIEQYATLVFDCDGVVLDSNKVKTDAFYQATLPYGKVAAQAMVDYHVVNGGVSRYKKFAHFLEKIAPNHAPMMNGPCLEELLLAYGDFVRQGLMTCTVAPGLEALRKRTPTSRWLIVSGGDQDELRYIFAHRGLDKFFDGGVFGSPDTKEDILEREIEIQNLRLPALFLGDSKYDYMAASSKELDFLFISNWTELPDWKEWTLSETIASESSIESYVETIDN